MSSSNGFWLRRLPGFSRVLCFSTLCFIALLLPALPSGASEQSDLIQSLQQHLQATLAQLADLETKLVSWKLLSAESEQQVQALSLELVQQRQELENLRGELEALQMFSADSQKRVAELRVSLEASVQKLQQVSKILRDSADSWKQVADAERRVLRKWKFATILVGAGALLAGGVAGYFLGK